jgi:hypothetical protein
VPYGILDALEDTADYAADYLPKHYQQKMAERQRQKDDNLLQRRMLTESLLDKQKAEETGRHNTAMEQNYAGRTNYLMKKDEQSYLADKESADLAYNRSIELAKLKHQLDLGLEQVKKNNRAPNQQIAFDQYMKSVLPPKLYLKWRLKLNEDDDMDALLTQDSTDMKLSGNPTARTAPGYTPNYSAPVDSSGIDNGANYPVSGQGLTPDEEAELEYYRQLEKRGK